MTDTNNNIIDDDQELDYDGVITQDEPERIILPAGDYAFMVRDFERTTSKASEKKMVKIFLDIDGASFGKASIIDNMVLSTKMEWKLSQFFCGIGQKKHGEPLQMNWNAAIGTTGVVEVTCEESQQYGKQNRIKRYYDPAKAPVVDHSTPNPATYSSAPYTPGQF
ncbi:MAG: DUF669 domain-containing protein [Coriobacteriales bacterium]|jgi:hypothetical protein|nr:DUF669 domain-containing protein [Coriobacteriales bacterium]